MPEEFFNSQDSTNQSDNTNSQFSVDANTISVDTNDTPHADSYSSEELADPNKIVVTIADKDTPIVLLIGPPASGKTMTLVRLARYLRTQPGYTVRPDTAFRPAHDKNYERMCKQFDAMISNDYAADSTSHINFMLVKILYKGRTLCQILEAPGEDYYSPVIASSSIQGTTTKKQLPRYISNIRHNKNRKIWTVLVEPDHTNERMDTFNRTQYAIAVKDLIQNSRKKGDKILFIFNKIDKTDFVITPGIVNQKEALKEIANIYPNIFVPFKNENPITRFWKENNFDFIPFHTGDYAKTSDGSIAFEPGSDIYPENLWKTICKLLRG